MSESSGVFDSLRALTQAKLILAEEQLYERQAVRDKQEAAEQQRHAEDIELLSEGALKLAEAIMGHRSPKLYEPAYIQSLVKAWYRTQNRAARSQLGAFE